MLLRDDGLMCCIGQACKQLGVPDDKIRNQRTVAGLPARYQPAEFLGSWVTAPIAKAYGINDEEDTDDAHKEAALIPLFAEMGLLAEFIN